MTFKKLITIGITAALAACTIAVTALTSVSGYSKPYKSGYSYNATGNSYVNMNYHEISNFVQTRATNKKSKKTYTRVGVYVYTNDGYFVDGSNVIRDLTKKGTDGQVGVNGCYNYRSSGATNYQHTVTIYSGSNHSNAISSVSKTVG